jgi:hypothetical protein
MILIGLIAIIFAIIGGTMASNRNRSPIGWAVICFFTGFIGIIILAIVGDAQGQNIVISAAGGTDIKRWNTLKEVDPDIANAATEAQSIGPMAERKLAEKYLVLNDKSYLPALLENLRKDGPTGDSELQVINGIQCRIFADGSAVITRGKHVGKIFPSVDELKAFTVTRR